MSTTSSTIYFMFLDIDGTYIGLCLEGFLYGKISVLCVPLSNEVQLLFPGLLGLYSGIFAIYLKCQLNKSRKSTIVFYALCLLYILSTFTVVCDLLIITLQLKVSNILSVKLLLFKLVIQHSTSGAMGAFPTWISLNDTQVMILRLGIVQTVATGCCDFLAQCQCIMVHINHCTFLNHLFLNLQRSTVAGLYGIKISASLSFLHSWQLHT
jgi:hypothetical protein